MYFIVEVITCLLEKLTYWPIMLIVLQAPYYAQNTASMLWKGLSVAYLELPEGRIYAGRNVCFMHENF